MKILINQIPLNNVESIMYDEILRISVIRIMHHVSIPMLKSISININYLLSSNN